jgi:hypothetical protein
VLKKIILGGLLSVGLIVGAVLPAAAAEEEHKNIVWAQSGGRTTFEDPLVPGNSYTRTVQLFNDSDMQAISHFKVNPYGALEDGSYGTAGIVTMERSELAKWVTYDNGQDTYDIILEPGQTIEVPFTVTVPSDWVASGGQSAAVVISSEDYYPDKADEEKRGLVIETEYVHMLFANIQGSEPLRIDTKFIDLKAPCLMLDNSEGMPVELLIKNDGNVWTTAKHHVKIIDKIRYDAVAYEREGSKEVLAGSQTSVERVWPEVPALGIFEVQATVTIGGEEFTKTKTVFVFPLWLLIIVIAIILLLITALILKIRDHRAAKKQAESN